MIIIVLVSLVWCKAMVNGKLKALLAVFPIPCKKKLAPTRGLSATSLKNKMQER